MLAPTYYTISSKLLQQAQKEIPNLDSRLVLNNPTGKFFSDPWEIKPEFKGTVWEKVLDSIKEHKGEARLIKLGQGECYPSHADIDDRWHLTITGDHSYLLNLDANEMYPTITDGKWSLMNAGIRHSAANFGSCDRIQLVVRRLLLKPNIVHPVKVSIKLKNVIEDRRFMFDDIISPWLNRAYKAGIIDDFKGEDLEATLTIEADAIKDFKKLIRSHFTLRVL